MRVALKAILEQQNRTLYWLSKETKCNYYGLQKFANNTTTSISFDVLEKICNALNCTADKILIINEYDNEAEE